MSFLFLAFGLICGQDPSHTWSPGGLALPICQRCTGLYAGAALALGLHAALRFRPGSTFLWVHGGFLLAMIPLGYHWVPQDAVVRAVSGVLFGAGIVSFLRLLPGPHAIRPGEAKRSRPVLYAVGLTVAVVGVPSAAVWGGVAAWYSLVALAATGVLALAALTGASARVLLARA